MEFWLKIKFEIPNVLFEEIMDGDFSTFFPSSPTHYPASGATPSIIDGVFAKCLFEPDSIRAVEIWLRFEMVHWKMEEYQESIKLVTDISSISPYADTDVLGGNIQRVSENFLLSLAVERISCVVYL